MKLQVGLILAITVLGVMLWGVVALATPCTNSPCNGTNGSDELTGDGSANEIYGLGGNDHLIGGGGKDFLAGGPGYDWVQGNAGEDYIDGAERISPDLLLLVSYLQQGGPKQGGPRTEVLEGGPGNDTISARDGTKDIVRGGPGRDTVYVDPKDTATDVEVVNPPGPTTTPTPGPTTTPTPGPGSTGGPPADPGSTGGTPPP